MCFAGLPLRNSVAITVLTERSTSYREPLGQRRGRHPSIGRSRNERKLRKPAFRNLCLGKLRRPLNTSGLPEEVLKKKHRKFRLQHTNLRRKWCLATSNNSLGASLMQAG